MASPTNSTANNDSTLTPSAPIQFPVVKYISQDISLKLTRENFILWKAQVLPVLRTHRLVGLIDGSFPKPIHPADDVDKWVRLDQMVLGWLLGSLSPPVLAKVVDKPTSQAAWTVFETSYGLLSRARIQQLKSELQSLHKGSSSVPDFTDRAKAIALALASAGKPVDDDDLVLCVLRGLGSEFDPIVAAINSRVEPPTFDQTCGLLLDYELRLSSSSPTAPVAAFTAASTPLSSPRGTTPSRPGSSSSSTFGGRPSGGRGFGGRHRGRLSAGRGRGRSFQQSSSSAHVVCYRCGHPYHKANTCWAPDDVVNSAKALNAMALSDPSDPNWYLDTGATHTMTPLADDVSGKTPYTGTDRILVGNCDDPDFP